MAPIPVVHSSNLAESEDTRWHQLLAGFDVTDLMEAFLERALAGCGRTERDRLVVAVRAYLATGTRLVVAWFE